MGLSEGYGVSGNSLGWKKRYSREGTLNYQESSLHYRPIAFNLTICVVHVGTVLDMEFQVEPLKGRRNTANKVSCSTSRVPSVTV